MANKKHCNEKRGGYINKRQIVAFVVGTIGFLLIVGTFGQAEFYAIMANEFYIRCGIGALLMCAALPLFGEQEEQK